MKKSRGGQSSHGGIRFLKTSILPKGKLHIGRLVDGVINEMIADLGGENEITASQKIIISAIRQNLIFLSLVNEWLAMQPSIIDMKGEILSPLNGFFLACQNTVTRNCRELGLKRVGIADSLESYLAENYGKGKDKREPICEPLRAQNQGRKLSGVET